MQSLFFKKSKTNKGKGETDPSPAQGKSLPTFNTSRSIVALIRRENLWRRPKSCGQGAANGQRSVWLCRSARVTHASQAGHNAGGQGSRSRVGCCWALPRKQRWPLCAQCVGLCTPFPSKLAREGQKSGSLAGFNGRMM